MNCFRTYILGAKDFKPRPQNKIVVPLRALSKISDRHLCPFYVAFGPSSPGQISSKKKIKKSKQMKLLLPSGQSKEKLNPSASFKMTGFILRITGIIVVVIQLGENMTLAAPQIDSMLPCACSQMTPKCGKK